MVQRKPAPSEKHTPPEKAEPSKAKVKPGTANVVVGEPNAKPREEAKPVNAEGEGVGNGGTEKKKPGRKVSPLTHAIRDWEKAKAETGKWQRKADRFKDITAGLQAAKEEEAAKYAALQKLLQEQGATG